MKENTIIFQIKLIPLLTNAFVIVKRVPAEASLAQGLLQLSTDIIRYRAFQHIVQFLHTSSCLNFKFGMVQDNGFSVDLDILQRS